MTDARYLNLGCGNVILPCERPWHMTAVDAEIFEHPNWHNVDRNMADGVDETLDLFTYPWPWPDNHFDGALLSHLVEHIPHDSNMAQNTSGGLLCAGEFWQSNMVEWRYRCEVLDTLQDGWFVFFSELWRVLKPAATAHVLVPHGNSDGARSDPTHTRYVMPHTFGYFGENENGTFDYAIGSKWEISDPTYRITEMFQHMLPTEDDSPDVQAAKATQLQSAIMVNVNVVYEFYIKLRTLK